MSADWLDGFLAEEGLPPSFAETVERVCRPLADRALALRAAYPTIVVGLCGAQGSGKSTIAAATARLLHAEGIRAVALSLDDFYLGRDARGWLAERVHPLLAVRGPPGTHDIALAIEVLEHLGAAGTTPLPAFDKATDNRRPKAEWRSFEGPAEVAILEGWCVGARPQPREVLATPVNALEREEDPDGRWRGFVNDQLAGPYQALFARLHALVLLRAPDWGVVREWRAEQESKLRARTGQGMAQDEIARFVAHYERITRWILDEMPDRADWTVALDPKRRPMRSS